VLPCVCCRLDGIPGGTHGPSLSGGASHGLTAGASADRRRAGRSRDGHGAYAVFGNEYEVCFPAHRRDLTIGAAAGGRSVAT
jgi:hypothetical protein